MITIALSISVYVVTSHVYCFKFSLLIRHKLHILLFRYNIHMLKHFILIILCFSAFNSLLGQEDLQNYYVAVEALNLRESPDVNSRKIQTLNEHDNLLVYELGESQWVKVSFEGKTGYVSKQFIKKGKAVVSYYSYRIGAVCKDGSLSSATGRGACSHHGGVSTWRYGQRKSVRIENN
ncbi:SH3 domain-containing protein [Roseivirga thermotolerans]|uniref:SH3 domain-containing protein n=1 Tax=Roseivirga thermotolerans TaxID=1758176 RepID=UPI00273D33B1|nr:SH3 domain-containing protein [Roseivirga thermotolerans]